MKKPEAFANFNAELAAIHTENVQEEAAAMIRNATCAGDVFAAEARLRKGKEEITGILSPSVSELCARSKIV